MKPYQTQGFWWQHLGSVICPKLYVSEKLLVSQHRNSVEVRVACPTPWLVTLTARLMTYGGMRAREKTRDCVNTCVDGIGVYVT